jgi:hypothetical protein
MTSVAITAVAVASTTATVSVTNEDDSATVCGFGPPAGTAATDGPWGDVGGGAVTPCARVGVGVATTTGRVWNVGGGGVAGAAAAGVDEPSATTVASAADATTPTTSLTSTSVAARPGLREW